jgi:hypothetical protein
VCEYLFTVNPRNPIMTGIYKLPEYEQHPIAQTLMPGGMDDAEFDAFCEDVLERSILFPATLYEGKVLDGWHRYRAAKRTGSELKFLEYKGKDPAGYIASCNVMRRRLSSLQRALVGARLHRDHGITQRGACKKLAISNEVLSLVLKAIESKNSKIIKRIENESDFTRGMLKEELEDAGLLRAKPKEDTVLPVTPATPFSGLISAAGAASGLGFDTDGTEDELLDTSNGLKAGQRASKKPKTTAAQIMSEEFQALMEDEKITFLQMIWPVAGKLVEKLVEKHKIAAAYTAIKKANAKHTA